MKSRRAVDFMHKYFWTCIPIGLGAGVALFIVVILTENTFGQRCAKAYSDPAERELCVKRVSNGGPVYKENVDQWGEWVK